MENIIEKASEKLMVHCTKEQNILKVIEECAELQEVLIKHLTRNEQFKPKLEKMVEEMGDVVFRIVVLSKLLDVEDDVQNRMEQKAEQLHKWAVSKFETLKN